MTGLLVRPADSPAVDAVTEAEILTLPAGPRIRPARPDDMAAVTRFLAGLSLDSAYRRFFTGLGTPSPSLVRKLVETDRVARDAVVAVLEDPAAAEEVLGLADYARVRDQPGTVEIGVVVADAWQRHGLGPRLATAALELARGRGATRMRAHCLAENAPIARILRRSWPDAHPRWEDSLWVWDVPLPPPAAAPKLAGDGAPALPSAGAPFAYEGVSTR
jgi:GNAT superfamily N-acetyltransferase